MVEQTAHRAGRRSGGRADDEYGTTSGIGATKPRVTMAGTNIAKFKTDKVNVFYGAKQALNDVTRHISEPGHRTHRALGLR